MKELTGLLTATLLLLSFTGCKSAMNLTSNSLDREVTIDGSEEEWVDALQAIEKENFSLGLLNDEEFLYVTLVTADAQLRNQIMALGMTLWIDPEGGKDKTFGVRFPLGIMDSGLPPNPMLMQRDPEIAEQMFNESLAEFEVVREKDEDTRRWMRTEIEDMQMDANIKTGMFVYELKIPLRDEALGYSLEIAEGNSIGLGLETPEFDREAMREQFMRERGAAGGGRGGFGGGGVGGGGFGGGGLGAGGMGRGGQGPGAIGSSLDFWGLFSLATP